MRILVTGGAGYIGRVAVELLMDDGHEVAVLDNFSQGHASSIAGSTRLFDADLRDDVAVRLAVRQSRPDAVMHFAAKTIVPESMRNPGDYYAVNAAGTNNLLLAMVQNDVDRFVLSSTAAVYGHGGSSLIGEDSPLNPLSPYGSSKLMAERIVSDFAFAHGMKYATFRYFNVAGATEGHGEDHNPETHLIPSAIFAVKGLREPLTVFGRDYETRDGTAIRDYVHVVDLARAHILAVTNPEGYQTEFNLGAGSGCSVVEVISAVSAVAGREVPVVDGPRREGDPPVLVADIRRAESILKWRPERSSLNEVVESAWRWHERFPNGYRGTGEPR